MNIKNTKTKNEESYEQLFAKYGYFPDLPWKPKTVQEPYIDCFAYKSSPNGQSEKCTALKRVFCRYEDCHFYKDKKRYVMNLNGWEIVQNGQV